MSEPDHTTRTWTAVNNMEIWGGSFVSDMASLWKRADSANRAKLEAAFSEYFDKYADFKPQ